MKQRSYNTPRHRKHELWSYLQIEGGEAPKGWFPLRDRFATELFGFTHTIYEYPDVQDGKTRQVAVAILQAQSAWEKKGILMARAYYIDRVRCTMQTAWEPSNAAIWLKLGTETELENDIFRIRSV